MPEFKAKPFGEYYLLERVAVGGMAEIFKAKTYGVGGFEKLLAIKRILPHHAQNHEFITMLIDEAKIAVALNHINIVQVFDLGKIENDYFIAMEYVDGKDLRTVMRRCKQLGVPLTLENAVYIILELCKGLDYAHRKTDKSGKSLGVVHRDISPQNILISFEGEVKVVDFGIAKAANKVTETDAGVLKGKFSYMSPEQAQGFDVDRRTDIFSTGIIMYELLTGEKLFTGDNHAEILEKIRNFELEHPFLPSSVPSELEYIVAAALEPNLDRRYAFASDFQVELTKFLYSSSLDFTTRNLADLMKKIFSRELDDERKNDKDDQDIDEDTRSMMLAGHSESLVSKTDHSLDNGDATQDMPVPSKNKTIIKRFQDVLRKGSAPPKPKIALKKVPVASLAATNLAEERTEPLALPASLPAPPKPVLREVATTQPSYPSFAAPAASPRAETPREGSLLQNPARLAAMLFAATGILLLLVTLILYLRKPSVPQSNSPSEDQAQATPVPAATPTTPGTPAAIAGGEDLRRVNFDPAQVVPRAAKLFVVTTPPGAEVRTNEGRLLGVTPLEIQNVPPGKSLEFSIVLANYHEQEKLLTFEAMEEKRLNFSLEPRYGSIEVNSNPAGARVLLNKVMVGQTPLRFEKVMPETPTLLTIQKEGFEEYSISFRVKPEETRLFNKVLEEAIRAVLLESSPSGAMIMLNGANRGVTPREITDLTPGSEYLLILRASGYRDFVRKIKVDPDRGQRIFAKLDVQNQRVGTLFLESEPSGAKIIVNGQTFPQTTPAVLDQLRTSDVHIIKIVLDHYEPVELRVRVDAETITSRKVPLTHLTGRLTVKSDPPNADVMINGRKVGETPIAYFSVFSGEDLLVTLRKDGYKEQIRKLRIESNQAVTVNFTLEPLAASP